MSTPSQNIAQPAPAAAGNDYENLLYGAKQIANYIGKTQRQAQHLLETEAIPAFKIGGVWHLRPSTWTAFIANREAEAEARVNAPASVKQAPALAPRRRSGNRKAA